MKRHPVDLSSLALGLIAATVAIAVILRRTPSLIGGGAWWLALAAIVIGLALIPWRRAAPRSATVVGPGDGDGDADDRARSRSGAGVDGAHGGS